jgi:dTDP-4-amino-4,6-dideoxygalactose transaminase
MSGLTIPFTGLKKQYHNLRQEILDATDEVLRSGQLMNGNHTAEFENWLAKKNRSKYAIAVHSGTAALECIAEYCRMHTHFLDPRPMAVMPSLTYSATANAFIRAGWDVHFIDTDKYGIFDFDKIPPLVSFQAIVLVGLYGTSIVDHPGMERWRSKFINWVNLAKNDFFLIEDAAQHWLASDCGRIGHSAAISFDPMKNLPAYGNGGAVVTDDADLYHFARAWRNNGKETNDYAGTNSRMSEIDCASLLVKSRYIDQWQRRRADIATYWRTRLQNADIRCMIGKETAREHAYHKFVIELDNRDQLAKELQKRKIETRIHYVQPLHEIGVFRQYNGPDILSVSSSLARRVLSLPFYPELSDLEVEYVIDQVLGCVDEIETHSTNPIRN